jgi:pantoate--beta-alanine ligase
MKVVSTIQELERERKMLSSPVGFVPTMGFLHEGHLSLVRGAGRESKSVVVSIFVNPTQFGPEEDLASYPRDVERDLKLLENEGVNLVFTPEASEMYPPGYSTWIEVEGITHILEGASRPGHFRGVATVVLKLLNIVQPDRAYFGQKDAQQAVVIQRMVSDLNLDIKIVILPTLREPDGLAMSSRNTYLSPSERKVALCIFDSLRLARELYQGGERSTEVICRKMTDLMLSQPQVKLDYVGIVHPQTFKKMVEVKPGALVLVAAWVEKVRLIDNILV